MPCNLNQRELAPDVKRGIREAGGTPMEFNTISVSDGVSMGTTGMRASLVSRETIADSIELVARGHLFDGLVCLVACDKTLPAAVMALARLDIPGLCLYTGSIAPGRFRGATSRPGRLRADRRVRGREDLAEELHELEGVACPAAGACGGQFTANTMATALEFLGISPAGQNDDPRARRLARGGAEQAGRVVVDLVRGTSGRRRSSRKARSTMPSRRSRRRAARRTASSICVAISRSWASPVRSTTSTRSSPHAARRRPQAVRAVRRNRRTLRAAMRARRARAR